MLLVSVLLLFVVMLALMAFRDPSALPVSEDHDVAEPTCSEASEGCKRAIPYVALLGLFIFSVATGMIYKFFPLFFLNICGFSRLQITMLQAVEPTIKALIGYLIGVCAGFIGREQMTCICLAALVACLLAMSVLSNLWGLLTLLMLRGGLCGGTFPLVWSILMDHVPASQRGRWSSALTVLNMSWSGAAVLGGKLLDMYGYPCTFRVVAGLFGVVLAIFTLLRARPQSSECTPKTGDAEQAPQDACGQVGQVGQVVVVVDPFSTGGVLAAELLNRGYLVISLWTRESETRHHEACMKARGMVWIRMSRFVSAQEPPISSLQFHF